MVVNPEDPVQLERTRASQEPRIDTVAAARNDGLADGDNQSVLSYH